MNMKEKSEFKFRKDIDKSTHNNYILIPIYMTIFIPISNSFL